MTKITAEDIQALKAKFPADAHSIHEGHTIQKGKRCAWYIFLDRMAIMERLDELFPGEWSYTMEPVQERAKHFGTVGHLTIRGITRSFNGTQLKAEHQTDDNTEKGCGTNTFRRVASMWGIGGYLYTMPDYYTDKPVKGEWDRNKKLEADALKQFNNWLSSRKTNESAKEENGKKKPVADSNEWSDSRLAKFIENMQTRFPQIEKTHPVILATNMGIENFQVLGTRKQAWSKIMEYCYGNNYDVMVNWKRYFVVPEGEKGSNRLEFTADPIAKNGHGEIRAYGRSDKFKKMLDKLGDGNHYEALGLGDYDEAKEAGETTDWEPIEKELSLVLSYKTGGSKEYPYDTCTGVKLPEFAEIF